ncbi:serine hydrolase domain-containing protein [Peribacillus sp. FSL R5-0717]|uniref:serine hydrolase domain-containing protein n=1 Tax=Peribacillus sp. FSL R5-0717 TaxID=2975308 RepID=UPI0030FC3485
MTVQHLLEHTSGWPSSADPMFGHLDLNQHQLITWVLDNEPLTYVPGKTFDYLNFGYCLLGRVIERISGISYANFVRQYVLEPCGITICILPVTLLRIVELTKLCITRKATGILTQSRCPAWIRMEVGLHLQRISFVSSFAWIVSPLNQTSWTENP